MVTLKSRALTTLLVMMALLVLVEVVTRAGERSLLDFATEELDYKQLTYRYPRSGQHEVVFVGDSRAREAFVAPLFEERTSLRS